MSTQNFPLPLKGVRIIDVTQALAGPFAAMILGDLGAEIIKVERPTGDPTRGTPPHYVDGESLYFLANNRNKRSIGINLKSKRGREVFYDLVRHGDAVFYNYSPGVAARLGMDHDSLEKINPRVITCSITGFGERGSRAKRPLVDVVAQSLTGAMSVTGEEGRPPVRAGFATADLCTGLYGAIGILSALAGRQTTGKGMKVETSLFHAQLSLLNYHAAFSRFTGVPAKRLGSAHAGHAVHGAFKTQDGWITIEAAFNKHFHGVCRVIGMPEMIDDPKYVDDRTRNLHRTELLPILEQAFLRRKTADLYEALDKEGVPVGPVNNMLEAVEHPQAVEYGAIRPLSFENSKVDVLTTPLWFNGVHEHPMKSPPVMGADTVDILRNMLSYDAATVDRLLAEGAVFDRKAAKA